jgi:hypothetical protein
MLAIGDISNELLELMSPAAAAVTSHMSLQEILTMQMNKVCSLLKGQLMLAYRMTTHHGVSVKCWTSRHDYTEPVRIASRAADKPEKGSTGGFRRGPCGKEPQGGGSLLPCNKH